MAVMDRNTGLTDKQERFCLKYVECLCASDAYRQAYECSPGMRRTTIRRRAAELMRDERIRARIAYLKDHLAEASGVSALRVLREHCRIAFADGTRIRTGWMTLKDFESLTADERALVRSVETKTRKIPTQEGQTVMEEWVKVTTYDKQKALDSIAAMLGYNAPQKIEGALQVQGLTVEVLDADTAERLKKLAGR